MGQICDKLAARRPKLSPLMDEANAEVPASTVFSRERWRKLWSTNPLERVNDHSSGSTARSSAMPASWASFRMPQPSSGSSAPVLIDMHDEWIAGDRRHLTEGSVAKLYETSSTEPVVAIESRDV